MSPKNLNASNKTHKFLLNQLKDKQTFQIYKKFEKNETNLGADNNDRKRRRKRITKNTGTGGGQQNKTKPKRQNQTTHEEPSDEEIQKQIRETLEKLQGKTTKSKGAKYRREKRDSHRQKSEEDAAKLRRIASYLRLQ